MKKIVILLQILLCATVCAQQPKIATAATGSFSGIGVVNTINDLRSIVGEAGAIIYVKGHTAPGDGGGGNFIWSSHVYLTSEYIDAVVNYKVVKNYHNPFYNDNNGTLIQVKKNGALVTTGRWVRQYDGYINVRYFGVYGQASNKDHYTQKIKSAIDFAYANASIEFKPEDGYAPVKGTTVYFPNGTYVVNNIPIRNGVALLGDSFDKTIIVAAAPGDPEYIAPGRHEVSQYLFQLDKGVVQTTVTNFNIVGRDISKGCFYLVGRRGENGEGGGLWNSVFKNIKITGFLGNGMYLKGGDDDGDDYDYSTPAQFNTFENISFQRKSNNAGGLIIEGAVGQQTFTNCLFNGTKEMEDGIRTLNENISIKNLGPLQPAVISFINCSIQDSDYGVKIRFATNITFDTCWFESLGVAIRVESDKAWGKSKAINITGNFFANAAGFGTLTAPGNISAGRVIDIYDSQVNVLNNFVRVSNEGSPLIDDDLFIDARFETVGVSKADINVQGNSFMVPALSHTNGIK